ncbi:MAG: NAD(P)/FAD-dependent oxidoreductase [Actinobacteria bacterium]|nr:NAD(P)/FAD-dependent oxidoreductase [Actinomycetota bacterium]
MSDKQMKKIVIIGGGIAGLSAGCYAKMNGYDAHIFEMHNLPGGLCTSWKRKGYTFDNCIHWLSGTSSKSTFHRIWQELRAIQGKEIYYKEMSIKLFLKDQIINFYNDPDKLAQYLKKIAPEDSHMIDELAESVRKMYLLEYMPLTKAKELFNIIDKFKMIISFFPFLWFFKKYMKTKIDEFADRFKNPVLQQAIRSIKGLSPSDEFIGIPFLIASKDAGFPQGGSLKFAKSIEQRYTSLGGKIHYGAKIKNILVTNNQAVGIQLEDGTEVKSDIVISAADGYSTIFRMLDGKFINKKIRHIYENEPVVPSNLQVSIGVDMDLSSDANLSNSVYYLYELDKPIMIAGEEKKHIHIKNYAFDPTFAPKGKSTLVVAFYVKSAYWEQIYKDKAKYKQEKQNVETAVIDSLEQIIPGIKEKIEVIDVSTPMTLTRYTNNWQGSIMGFKNGLVLNIPRTLPKLKNFYMAGQWVGDAGLPGAAGSGREILEYICKKDKKRFITTKP